MRARNIKPGYFKNDLLSELPPLTRILFAGLWCIADRSGRLEDRPKRIKADVLPYDDCDVSEMLEDLATFGFLIRYETASGRFIQVVNFDKHQNPHKNEAPSTIEAPESHSTSTVQDTEPHTTNPADSLIPDSLIPDSLIPDSGFVTQEIVADAPQRPTAIALEIAETMVKAPWINDEIGDIAAEVDRLFGKVPTYKPRDGPALAEVFVAWKGYVKNPPGKWNVVWLNWLRKEVREVTKVTDIHGPDVPLRRTPDGKVETKDEYKARQMRWMREAGT